MITTQQIIIKIMITMIIVMIIIIIMITFIKNDDNESNGRIMMVRMTMVMWVKTKDMRTGIVTVNLYR